MSELVQLHLESTLPELEQMERIGLFSEEEIKKIIKKRKALEYLLRRRKKRKEDFLKYIQYEVNVLSLIAKRRQRLGCEFKRQEIDHAIATRINKLFKAVTARFQNDEKLWLTQIQFCQRMKWHHTISALFSRMLQVHNNKPELWVMAAKWEFEENNAPENARQLLQRALRFHPESRHLWTEYFRMELMYTDLVLKRQEALGLQEIKDVKCEDDAVLKGKIASFVYEKATEAIPDVDFAVSLIDICKQFEFAVPCGHINQIFQDIQRRHPLSEITLDAVAKRPLITIHQDLKASKEKGSKKKAIIFEVEEKICASYDDAVAKVKSEKMWSLYIDFAISRWKTAKKEKKKLKLLNNVIILMGRASSEDLLACDLHAEWCKFLERKGDTDSACSVALQSARKWPKKVFLWVLCLTLHIQARKESNIISDILNEAMESLPVKKSLPVWNLGMQWLSLSDPSELKNYFEKAVQSHKAVSVPMKEMFLEVTALRDGIQAARELYKRLRVLYPLSPELFRKMIHIESAQLKSSIKWLRTYYEDAIKEYGSSDIDFWLDLMQLEMEHPDGDRRNRRTYYWRALKTLNEHLTDSFVSLCTLTATGHSTELSQ